MDTGHFLAPHYNTHLKLDGYESIVFFSFFIFVYVKRIVSIEIMLAAYNVQVWKIVVFLGTSAKAF